MEGRSPENNDSNNLGRQVDFYPPLQLSSFFGIAPLPPIPLSFRETVFGKSLPVTFFPPWPTEGEGERYQIFRGFPISTPGGEEPRGRGLKRARFAWGRRPRPSANLHPEPADNIDPKMVAVVVVLYQRATPGRESWRRRRGSIIPFLFSSLFPARS